MVCNWWKVGRPEAHARRLRRMRARILRASNFLEQFGKNPVAYTLTYKKRGSYAWGTSEISEMLAKIRKDFKLSTKYRTHNLRYVWVAELQRDGTPHFHLIMWDLPKLHLDTEGYWVHGWSSCDGAARNGAAYAVSYAGKLEKTVQKRDAFPKSMRISGAGGLTLEQKRDIARASLPSWAQMLSGARRWRDRIVSDLGDVLKSPFYVNRAGHHLFVHDCRSLDDTSKWQEVLTAVEWYVQEVQIKENNKKLYPKKSCVGNSFCVAKRNKRKKFSRIEVGNNYLLTILRKYNTRIMN